jgi:uncharacterized protein YigE (DUF2233 family)
MYRGWWMRLLIGSVLAAACGLGMMVVAFAAAAEIPAASDRGPQLLQVLAKSGWQPIAPGIENRAAVEPAVLEIHAYKLSQKAVRVRMLTALAPEGSGADQVGAAAKALLVINGGYFQYGDGQAMEPTGLLMVDGVLMSPRSACRACSGVLYADQSGLHIDFAQGLKEARGLQAAVQTGPMLVHPGGSVGIRLAGGPRAARSAVCLDGGDIVVLAALSPLTLFELATLLATPKDHGGFGCERAINLDGGPSTQIYAGFDGHAEKIGLPAPVENFVAFFAR